MFFFFLSLFLVFVFIVKCILIRKKFNANDRQKNNFNRGLNIVDLVRSILVFTIRKYRKKYLNKNGAFLFSLILKKDENFQLFISNR